MSVQPQLPTWLSLLSCGLAIFPVILEICYMVCPPSCCSHISDNREHFTALFLHAMASRSVFPYSLLLHWNSVQGLWCDKWQPYPYIIQAIFFPLRNKLHYEFHTMHDAMVEIMYTWVMVHGRCSSCPCYVQYIHMSTWLSNACTEPDRHQQYTTS